MFQFRRLKIMFCYFFHYHAIIFVLGLEEQVETIFTIIASKKRNIFAR